jgi:DNA-binding NtrC family response regulator
VVKKIIEMDILLIDDFFTAGAVKKNIEKLVRSIETANSAEDALIKIRHKKFDLVLLNISSKVFDGCKLIQQFKSICPDIKIVTMTDRNSRDLELKIRKQGVLFYMITPFNIKVLKDIVDYISSSKEESRIGKLQKFHNEWARL